MKQDGVLDFRGSALRDWEVDFLVRKRLRNLLFTSGNTLQVSIIIIFGIFFSRPKE